MFPRHLIVFAICVGLASATVTELTVPTTFTTTEKNAEGKITYDESEAAVLKVRATDDGLAKTEATIGGESCKVFSYTMPIGEEERKDFDHSVDLQTSVLLDLTRHGHFELDGPANNATQDLFNNDCYAYFYGWYAFGMRSQHALQTDGKKEHVQECPATKPKMWDAEDESTNLDFWNWTRSGELWYENCTDGTHKEVVPRFYAKPCGCHKDAMFFVAGQETQFVYIRNTLNGTGYDQEVDIKFQLQNYKGWFDLCLAIEDLVRAVGGLMVLLVGMMAAAGIILVGLPLCCCLFCVWCLFCRKKNQ